MFYFLQFIKALISTIIIIALPVLIYTGGSFPLSLFHNPIYQFYVLIVGGYAFSPIMAEFVGGELGHALFFPNRPNLGHPTMSHIISLRKKGLYEEAQDELRMLTDLHPDDIEPYKMLLHLSAFELPDKKIFDMIYRKGMFNLNDDDKKILTEIRDKYNKDREESGEWVAKFSEKKTVENSLNFVSSKSTIKKNKGSTTTTYSKRNIHAHKATDQIEHKDLHSVTTHSPHHNQSSADENEQYLFVRPRRGKFKHKSRQN